MAGVITHMVVAREIMKRLPEGTIQDKGLFYLGNLAPDAIHARKGYIRVYKKHTHLRDDIPDKDFAQEKNLELFHSRIADFIIENRNRKDDLLDMYRGYVAHLLADEVFTLTIRREFCELLEQQGIVQSDPRFFEYIVADMKRNDLLLVSNYEGSEEIRLCMEQVPVQPVNGFLSAKEICISRDWLVHQHFYENNELLEPRYISYERMWEFIQAAADDIVKRLSLGGSLPQMF